MRALSIGLLTCIVAVAAAFAAGSNDRSARALDHFIRGTVAEQAEDHFRAIFDFQEALRYDSTSAFIHTALAQSYLSIGSVDKAEAAVSRALRLDPNSIAALELRVLILRSTDRFKEARETLETLTKLDTANIGYRTELLSVLLTLQHYDAADRVYAGMQLDSTARSLICRQLVAVYLQAKEFKRCLPYLEQLRGLDSTDASVFFSSGTTALQLEDSIQALAFMEHATRLDPQEPRFWNGRALFALSRAEYERTIALADSGLTLGAPFAPLYNLRGVAQQRLKQREPAIASLLLAIKTDSTYSPPFGSLALLYDEMDSVSQAIHFYNLAITASDSAAVYLNNLAYTFAVRRIRLAEAEVLSARALAKEPDNPSYKDTMGWILFGRGDIKTALRWLKAAVKDSPDSVEVLEHLGDVLTADGALDKARDYFKRAAALDPGNERLREKAGS